MIKEAAASVGGKVSLVSGSLESDRATLAKGAASSPVSESFVFNVIVRMVPDDRFVKSQGRLQGSIGA